MINQDKTESKIKQTIERFVSSHWDQSQSVCYLSSIGLYLKHAVPEHREILTSGLKDFLRQNIIVQLVQFPGAEQKIGAVPLSIQLPEDVRELFVGHGSTRYTRERHVYLQEFWNAFISPIEGCARYVVIDGSGAVTVSEGPDDSEIQNAYEIVNRDLTATPPGGSIGDKVNATHSAIDNWLNKHSLERATFLRPERSMHDSTVDHRLANVFAAFDSLTTEELARIKIPLDILIKLCSKNGS